MLEIRLAPEPLAPQQEVADFLAGLRDEGAIASFIGRARPTTRDGEAIATMFLDHHPRLTEQSLRDIGAAALARFEISAARIVHRSGEVSPGDAIVFVAAASVHRRAAFEGVDYMVDRLKTDAVFWKREDAASAPRWIEPTDADRTDRARWED